VTSARGFSLVELVVVLVIVGILAVLFVPRLLDAEAQASWYTEQVKAGLRYAQRQAVAQRRSVYVEVQPARIRLCYTNDCSSGILTKITDGSDYVLDAPSGVVLSPAGVVAFDSLGRSAGATISVGSSSISVSAGSGYVQ